MLALLVAAIIGGALGLWFAAWCEDTHGHVRTALELETTSGLPCLAAIHGPGGHGAKGENQSDCEKEEPHF